MFYDAQTSGGLLLAVSPEYAEAVLVHAIDTGFGQADIIKKFIAGT